jgi:uncharacterized protein
MEKDELADLWDFCTDHFAKAMPGSDHGHEHWRRVERHALELARKTGANQKFVRLFAVLHDCCRQNETDDPQHGQRAADLADTLRGKYFDIDDGSMQNLRYALIHHDRGETCRTNVDIGTCWDADRLDLIRVDILPLPSFFSTKAGIDACMAILRKSGSMTMPS